MSENSSANFFSKMMNFLLEPSSTVTGLYDKRQSRFLAGLILSLTVVGFINEIYYTATEFQNGYRGFLFVIPVLLTLFLLYLFSRTRRYRIVAAIFLIFFFASAYYYSMAFNPEQNLWFLGYLVIPIFITGYFLSIRLMAFALPLVLLPDIVWLSTKPEFQTEINNGILIILILSAIITIVFTWHRQMLEKATVDERLALEDQFRMETEQLLSTITSIIIRLDPDNKVKYWNRPAEQFSGRTHKDVVQKNLFTLRLPWNEAVLQEAVQKCRSTKTKQQIPDISVQLPSGLRNISFTASPILQRFDEPQMDVLLYGLDITEQLLLQQQARLREVVFHGSQAPSKNVT